MGLSIRQHSGKWAVGALGCVVAIASSCNSVTVTSVGVTQVEVFPRAADLVTGQVLQMSASPLDGDGKTLTTASVEWRAEPAEIAQVDNRGRVIALAPGLATVSASANGVTGTATLSIGSPGLLALGVATLSFEAIAGTGEHVERTIQIAAADDGRVMDLATQVTYEGAQTGWLTADLDSDRAPANLSVVAATGTLSPGEYRATVDVVSGTATNSPMSIDVQLVVAPPPAIIGLSANLVRLVRVETRLVQVTNVGPGTLSGLIADVEYGAGEPSGWLSVGLSEATAPSTLALGSDDSALAPGTYSARVVVRAEDPHVEPRTISVSLDGGQQAPALSLNFGSAQLTTTVGGSAIVKVGVSNGGSGLLDGLRSTVGYAPGQPGGWLAGTLSSSTAPAVLTLAASAGGLAPGTYQASVEVVGNAPNSPVFLPVTFTVTAGSTSAPSSPSGLGAALTPTPGVSLTWTDNSSNETTFTLRRGVAGGGGFVTTTLPANTTSAVDNTVAPGSTYSYEVQACNASGCSAWAGPVTILVPTPGPVPAAPSGLVAQATGPWSVALGWIDNSTTEAGFDIRKRGLSGHWQILKTVPSNVTSDIDRGVLPGTTYDYQVRACSAQGCSTWSPVVSVTTPVPYQ